MVENRLSFYKGKHVLVTGHTGFKGTWLCKILINAGAIVTGYALEPPTMPNLFDLSGIAKQMDSIIDDIRNFERLFSIFQTKRPEIVFHLAAQPLVRKSYSQPRYTYETNVMGTVNVCECIRLSKSVKSFLNVTTDKVYKNNEWEWGYRENEMLDGFDPYSNSKSCSELVTHAYINSFFDTANISASTARAGNVIGGGDFAEDRIIPDCIRAVMNNEDIVVRNPHSIRPYQHVLEPLAAYLMIAEKQYDEKKNAGFYNVGPEERDCLSTGDLVSLFCSKWGNDTNWVNEKTDGPHEANYLKLDCSKIKTVLGWKPRWGIEKAVDKTIEWAKTYISQEDITSCMDLQIDEFYKNEVN